jgi:LL-diaminopimelate aminotransferase
MTGWRIGWVCGNRDVIGCLAQVKSNMDSGVFQAIQLAAIEALNSGPEHLKNLNLLYQQRRDILCQGLAALGWQIHRPQATFYIWARLPKGHYGSIKFARLLLNKADVIVTPGVGFGPSGEGYVRLALTVPKERLQEAITRIKKII